jgi:type II secretory pathway component GspD/PulD (secretin)
MRIGLHRAVVVLGLLAAAALAPAAHAQTTVRAVISGPTVYVTVNGATVRVPDGGTATVASYSEYAEGRSEYGVPILGKVPYVDRAVRNTAYGRHIATRGVSVSARIIDLREEEFRQTGFRSP